MLKFKSRLTKKEKLQITEMVKTISDPFSEFYLTKDRLRLYIAQNIELLFASLKKDDKICYNENSIAIIDGFSDNYKRHYIKFLSKNPSDIDNLLKEITWNLKIDIWAKIKKNNPLLSILQNNGFNCFADRGKEQLLYRPIEILKKDK